LTPRICVVVLWATVQNSRSTAITEQCCVCLGTTSCDREELNECLTDRYCLHTMKLNLRSLVSESPYSGVPALCLGRVLNFTALFRDRVIRVRRWQGHKVSH
jgi:hypothetical protein